MDDGVAFLILKLLFAPALERGTAGEGTLRGVVVEFGVVMKCVFGVATACAA